MSDDSISGQNHLPTHDSIGRGRKGKAHGSIAIKTVTRTRKSGKVATYHQFWYQWQDKTGKHSGYLNQKKAAEVRRLLEEGAIVAEILTFLRLD
jgi:hypothetical protein